MQYLLMLYADESCWTRMTPEEQTRGMEAYRAYTEALQSSGAYVGGNRLRPSGTATRVRANNDKTQVLDGPFSDSKEQLGGYYLIEAPDLDGALSWAARCPGAHHGTVEVRALWT